jgi:uncharacterized protein (DUF2141 family)
MKRILITAAFSLMASAASAQTTQAACPELEVSGLVANQGQLSLAVYDSADTYMKKPVWVQRVKVEASSQRVAVCGLDRTQVAVAGFQDLNDNGKMDFNLVGMPTEPYGASGKPPRFSAPTWDSTKVSWPPEANQAVAVKF